MVPNPGRTIHGVTSGRHYASSDPIADAIGLLRPRSVVEASLHASVPWAARFDSYPHVKFGGVVRGECLLTVDGHDPVLLREGDFFLLGNPPGYVLAGSPGVEPVDAATLWGGATGGVVRVGPPAADEAVFCGGHFSFDDTNAPLLLDVLPLLVHVRAADPRGAALAHLSALLIAEIESTAVGGSLVLDHLAQILFVHMLRAHADDTDRPTGWLGALGDDGIGAALRALHADVGHRWTLGELAGLSHMSRSTFAAAFRNRVGTAPLTYLIEWRMCLARDALRRGTRSISQLASATGYESESAFSTAFRRVVGSSPAQFREAARHGG